MLNPVGMFAIAMIAAVQERIQVLSRGKAINNCFLLIALVGAELA